MAHELEIINGQAQMFSAGNLTPWHGLGNIIEQESVTAAEAIDLAGLNWTVEKVPATYEVSIDGIPTNLPVPDKFVTVRSSDNSALGVVGQQYKILQNKDAFQFMDDLVDSSDAKYVTAGSLFNGRHIWALMQLPETISITDSADEDINQFILLKNSHDGSSAVTVAVTPVRVVCNNTLTLALNNTQRVFKVRHTQTMYGRTMTGKKVLGITHNYNHALQSLATELISSPFSRNDFNTFVDSLVPIDFANDSKTGITKGINKRELITDIYFNTPDLQNITGTKWGALQAVIDYNDHHIKGKGDSKSDNRMERIISQKNITHDAHKLLTV